MELSITPPLCDSCAKGKATRASFRPSKTGHAKTVLGLVHCDLWGLSPVETINGTRYVMTFTDDNSRWVWAHFLRRKSDAFAAFKEWLAYVEKETGMKLRVFRTDGGGEFIPKEWIQFLKDRGIQHEMTSPYTPEQNGVTERLNQTLFDHVRTIFIDSGLPLFLWAKAVNYIIHMKNRNPTSALPNLPTPFEAHFGEVPDIS